MKLVNPFVLLAALLFSQLGWAQSSPIPMLENAANQITNTLKAHKGDLKNNHQIIHQVVQKYLLPIVDVRGMSRSVLGRRAWKSATPAEKKAFIKEFTELVIRTYSTPLAQYDDETVKFLPLRGPINGRFVQVSSIVVRNNAPNVPLNYSLVSKKGQWKVYDLTVEGVSLLQSFRNQFSQVLQNSSMKELIAQMKSSKAG